MEHIFLSNFLFGWVLFRKVYNLNVWVFQLIIVYRYDSVCKICVEIWGSILLLETSGKKQWYILAKFLNFLYLFEGSSLFNVCMGLLLFFLNSIVHFEFMDIKWTSLLNLFLMVISIAFVLIKIVMHRFISSFGTY